MAIKFNYIFGVLVAVVIGLIIWNIYLMQLNTTTQKNNKDLEEKVFFQKGYIEILQHDVSVARDSIKMLKNENSIHGDL